MNETLIYILLFLAALAVLLQAVTLLRGRSGVQLMTQLEARLASLDAALERQEREIRGELARMRSESLETARGDRTEQTQALERLGQGLAGQVGQLGTLQAQQFEGFGQNLTRLTQSFDARVEQLRLTVETRLTAIQADNAAKLEEMRKTVDEKLHATLEQRLGESFKLVSDRLEQVPSRTRRNADAGGRCR
jgi:DNA recombination protein RmuC